MNLNGFRSSTTCSTDEESGQEENGIGLTRVVRFNEKEKDENVSTWRQFGEQQQQQQEQQEQQQKKLQIRNLSSEILSSDFGQVATQQQVNIDADRLHRAVKDAAKYAYAIHAVEVWILNEETGQLVRPGVRPALRSAGWFSYNMIPSDALRRLEDPTHPLYDDPQPCPPGCDLAGILYATTSTHTTQAQPSHIHLDSPISSPSPAPLPTNRKHLMIHFHHNRAKSTPCLDLSTHSNNHHEEASTCSTIPPSSTLQPITNNIHHSLLFRDINTIAQDPDSAKSSRLALLLEAGFTHAAGIHFNVAGVHGIVLYYTTIGHQLNQPMDTLTEEGTRLLANEYYLFRATDVIGAIVASIDARRAITVIRRRMDNSISTDDFALSYDDEDDDQHKHNNKSPGLPSGESCKVDKQKRYNFPKAIKTWWYKCQGAHMQVPPSSSWRQALFCFMGSIISFMLLLTMDDLFQNSDFHIFVGPLSAGIAAHYLLCSAPASQPRTSVLALIFTGLVSMIATYLPIPIWIRVLSAAAVSILGMAKLGVPYPPAASLAVAIAATKTSPAWGSLLLTVATNILLLIPAIFINNLNKNRQYPIYWGYNHCKGKIAALSDKQKEKS